MKEATPEFVTSTESIGAIDALTATLEEDTDATTARNTTVGLFQLASGVENNPLMEDPNGEPITVAESLAQLSASKRQDIVDICDQQLGRPEIAKNPKETQFWRRVRTQATRPEADICLGKSYGDPHMRTYDGHYYDLQSVGEFVLTKAINSSFEIQSRQSATSSSFSLNTAAAMNVNGDRVCVFSAGFPDSYTHLPIRVNGMPLDLKGGAYRLPNGGIIRMEGRSYRISWPTGEQCLIKFFSSRGGKFMNILPQVYGANNSGGYVGLLGNANGNPNDDLVMQYGGQAKAAKHFYSMAMLMGDEKMQRAMKKEEKQHNKNLAERFGESWRITNSTTLFDYSRPDFGTRAYTDRSFPKKHLSLADMSKEDLKRAKKVCEDAGVTGDALRGCMLDVGMTDDTQMADAISGLDNDEELVKEFKISNNLQTTTATKEEE